MTKFPYDTTGQGRRLGYARVSTEDQNLDMQRRLLTEAHCVQIFEDHGLSGARADRPGLSALRKALEPGDTLVVFKLDRLGRSVQNMATLLGELDARKVQFCSLTEGINTATPGGKMVFHIFAAIAEFHRELISENTRHGLLAAKKRGVSVGRPRALSADQARQIQLVIQTKTSTRSAAAKAFGVSESTVYRVLKSNEFDTNSELCK